MVKYYKFHYDAGYYGTEVDEVFKYDDCVPVRRVEDDFDEWYDEQRNDSGSFKEITEEEAERLGVDEDLTE